MKLVTAILRPEKLDELIDVVIDIAHGMTVTDVRGFGRQFGHFPGHPVDVGFLPVSRKPALLPKIRVDVLVLDDDADALVEAIGKHACTGTLGDGKIWVTPVDGAMRVRTGERGRDAVLTAADRLVPPQLGRRDRGGSHEHTGRRHVCPAGRRHHDRDPDRATLRL